MDLELEVVDIDSLRVPIVALVFSAVALAVALLSAALPYRLWQVMQASAQDELAPQAILVPVAEHGAGAWHGNADEGYVRGPFNVKRMPKRESEVWRGNEGEWVAYANGERVAASPDLAEVLAYCEGLE